MTDRHACCASGACALFAKAAAELIFPDRHECGKGEPIAETPRHALDCMLAIGLDAVVFPEHVAIPKR